MNVFNSCNRNYLPLLQVVPDVVSKVTGAATLVVEYDGKPVKNGDHLKPSETQVLSCSYLLTTVKH